MPSNSEKVIREACIKKGRDNGQYRHGRATTKTTRDPLYIKWSGIKRRCLNKNDTHYKFYGGRGIKVCDRWMDFIGFMEDMGPTFKPGMSIDRLDVNGDYEPSNCRWIDVKDQQKNKRSEQTRFIVERILSKVKELPSCRRTGQIIKIIELELKKL